MKIAAHFAPKWHELAFVLAATFWLIAASGIVASAFLYARAMRLQEARPALAARFAELQGRVGQIGHGDLPPRARLVALRRRVASINRLAGVSGWPLIRVLARLETLLPRGARLSSLEDKVYSGQITLIAEARDARTLTIFLARLQKVTHFRHVLLMEQRQYRQGGASWTRCKLRILEGRV